MRLFSILDFEELCDEMGLGIERRVALDRARGRVVEDDPNRLADLAIFVIRGSRSAQSADFVPFTKNPSAR